MFLPPLAQRWYDADGQKVHDQDHQDAIDHPLHLRRDPRCAQDLWQQAKNETADDRPGQRALAPGDHHDDHRHGIDEQEDVRVDDAHVVRVESTGSAGHRGRHHGCQHQISRHIDTDGSGERLVLPERDHGAAGARVHQPSDQHVAHNRHHQHQIVVGGLAQERQFEPAWHTEPQRRDIVERHRPLRQLHPIEGHQPNDLGETHGDDHEIGSAHLEGNLADHPSAGARECNAQQHAEPNRLGFHAHLPVRQQVDLEPQGHEARDIGADAKERDVTQAELPRVAEQEIEAHGRDDEDAGDDQYVQDVEVAHPQRH